MTFPKTILVRARINEKLAAKLVAAGLPEPRGRDEQAVLRRHAEEAGAAGLDPYRRDRGDAAGNKRPDSGVPVFGKTGIEEGSLRHLSADLAEHGFRLTAVWMLQKEGDNMVFLNLRFIPTTEEPVFMLTPEAAVLVSGVLNRRYRYLHVFANPDGSATVNPAHAMDDGAAMAGKSVSYLRLEKEGFVGKKVAAPATTT